MKKAILFIIFVLIMGMNTACGSQRKEQELTTASEIQKEKQELTTASEIQKEEQELTTTGEPKKEEEDMNTIYCIGLAKYLTEKLDLDKYEKMMADSDMNYIPKDKESQKKAQKEDVTGFSFIYIRNEMHTDRLKEEEQKLLASQDPSKEYSEQVMKLIEDTYENVASSMEITSEEDRSVKTCYDNSLHPDFVPVNAIVIRISTMPEYDEDGNYVNEEHESEKAQALETFVSDMQNDVNGKLGNVPVVVQID